MGFLKMVAGGVVGGLIGAAIWVAVGHFTGYEVGWIAWGIGFLVGIGVKIMGQEEMVRFDRESGQQVRTTVPVAEPIVCGLTAGGLAVASVLIAKFAVVYLVFSSGGLESELRNNRELMVSYLADEVVAERFMAGNEVEFPAGVDPGSASEKSDYPSDVWVEAQRRWQSMSATEQDAFVDGKVQELSEVMAALAPQASQAFYLEAFSLFDLLWLGLAAFTAFKIGAGGEDED